MPSDLWSLYSHMSRSRLFEEAIAKLWHDGFISNQNRQRKTVINSRTVGTIILSLFMVQLVILEACSDPGVKYAEGSPEQIGKMLTENLLERDHMFYGEHGLHYAEACAAVGALRFTVLMDDQKNLKRLIKRYEKLLNDDSNLISRRPHVDQFVIGSVPLQIYMINKDKRFLDQGLTFADSQWDDPREDGLTSHTRWWIDDLYMVCMLQMQAYPATGDMKYADHAAIQMSAYLDTLQKDIGLFHHGPDSPFFWGRGNGWVASAMAEVLLDLPEDHSLHSDILDHYLRMMKALLLYQTENGMWRQVVNYEYSWNESSCTAMFAYAMSIGLHNGWLEEVDYKPAVKKAYKALAAHVDSEGNVREICVGTGKVDDIEYYLKRPRQIGDFHGQAPLLWLISELLQNR
ncbi:glycoside hydrolase family 88 protein [candidate division KSB1 bacterium]|nr:glycoside hydrolase family 88 protein [candidate division KSB1 bacterium]